MDYNYLNLHNEAHKLERINEQSHINLRSRRKSLQRNPSFSYKHHDMFNIPNHLLPQPIPPESCLDTRSPIFIKPRLTRLSRGTQ